MKNELGYGTRQNKEIQTKTSSNISMILVWKGECSIPISYLIPVQSTAKTRRKFKERGSTLSQGRRDITMKWPKELKLS